MNKTFPALLLLFVSLLLGGCGKKESSSIQKVEQVRLNLSSEPITLDPRKGGDVISSHMHFLLFEGLVRLNDDRSITPGQAEAFEISPDGLVYTFHLRPSLWSNGSPVTANDFAQSWKDILSPTFPSVNAHLLYPIRNAESAKKGLLPMDAVGIEAKDARTLVITLEKPTPYFLDLVSFCVFFPVHTQIDSRNSEWAYNAGQDFVSNGPYMLTEWKHKNEIVVVANPFYWDHDRVVAPSIHFSMIEQEMTALQMFENGQLDMVGEPLSPLPTDAILDLEKKGKLKHQPIPGTTMIAFNTQQFPFSNVHIRKAFAYAINREDIVQNITQLNEQVGTCAIPPVLKKGKVAAFFPDGNKQLAQEMLTTGLEELGISLEEFPHITYFYNASELHRKIAQAIQQQWAETLGIHVKLENMEFKVLMDKLSKRNFQIGQTTWVAQYNDPMNILERFKFRNNVKNYASWENPEYIQLLDQSAYQTGEEREAILTRAEALFLDEMPISPIFHWDATYIVQPYLKGVGLSPIGDIYFENLEITGKVAKR